MNKELTNFTDQEIQTEFLRRIEINKSISLLEDLSRKIREGKIKTGASTLTYAQDDYVYSLDLKTGQLERRKL